MNELVPVAGLAAPMTIAAAGDRAQMRFVEFFTAHIRNRNTRRAYGRAVESFFAWTEAHGLALAAIQPLHVATWIEELARSGMSSSTVKQHLAAVRMMLDWLATGGVLTLNPASAVRGPRHSVTGGKTPVLSPEEARQLLGSIDTATPIGLRDRALLALMVFSFARVGAALGMKVEDVYVQNRRLWVRLHEKGGKLHTMPCHHTLEDALHAYVDGCGLAGDPKGPLFRTIGRGTGQLTTTPCPKRTRMRWCNGAP